MYDWDDSGMTAADIYHRNMEAAEMSEAYAARATGQPWLRLDAHFDGLDYDWLRRNVG